MYTLTFANGTKLEVIDGVLSLREMTEGEQRDAFSFQVRAEEIGYADLLALVSNPKNTNEIMLTNDSARGIDPDGNATDSASEIYYGYIDMMSVKYIRRIMQEGLLNVPSVYEWVYEVFLAEQSNAQLQSTSIDAILADISDADAINNIDAFPLWTPMGRYVETQYTGRYEKGYRVRYNELLYKCRMTHETQAGMAKGNPADNNDLWECISEPSKEWPGWKQPLGAQDAYKLGTKVTHKGRRWISVVAVNVWEPGVYGWEEVV